MTVAIANITHTAENYILVQLKLVKKHLLKTFFRKKNYKPFSVLFNFMNNFLFFL